MNITAISHWEYLTEGEKKGGGVKIKKMKKRWKLPVENAVVNIGRWYKTCE